VILVCAATGTEAGACRRGIADSGAAGFEVLATGVGPERAAAALSRRLAIPGERPDLVVSAGFAGALTEGIEPLAWVTASAVHRCLDGRAVPVPLGEGMLRLADGATPCDVVSTDAVLSQALPGLGHPAAVDMESGALAAVAGAAGVRFAVLRMVTDTPGHPLAAVGRRLAAAFGARDLASRAAHGARAAVDAAQAPLATLAFLREGVRWRNLLRAGWRRHAGRGLPTTAASVG
jgi:hypothetical protein